MEMCQRFSRLACGRESLWKPGLILILFAFLTFLPENSLAQFQNEQCLSELLAEANPKQTVGELREKCKRLKNLELESNEIKSDEDSAIDRRIALESLAQDLPFLLTPHKPNYFLPFGYNSSPNQGAFNLESLDLDEVEFKFQFSMKSRIVKGILNSYGDLWFAYSNLSLWQAYNTDYSSPFRETNHEPELFLDFHPKLVFGKWKNSLFRLGFVHQSNGRGGNLSRSWNRIYLLTTLENHSWHFGLKPWYRIPERSSEGTDQDDNPDIHKFMGYGEIFAYFRGERDRIGLTFRNNLRESNKIGLQVDWTFPLTKRIRGYVQYFNGYGESLIDYNDSTNRVSLGFSFSEVL